MNITVDQARKGLVALSLEKTLLDIGTPVFEKVASRLYEKYQCYVPDCYDHPNYLKDILKEIFGNSYTVIFETIEKELDEFSYQKPIAEFLTVLSN